MAETKTKKTTKPKTTKVKKEEVVEKFTTSKKIFIMGHSGSGKSTLAKALGDALSLPRVKTVTSRPRREGEQDDDYHFISPKDFSIYFPYLQGVRTYRTQINGLIGDYSYGLPVKENPLGLPSLTKGGICIIDIEGYENVVDTRGVGRKSSIGFYIELDKDKLRERASSRKDFTLDEWERRYAHDSSKKMNSEYIDTLNNYNPLYPHKIYKLDGELSVEELVEQVKQVLKENE